MKSMDEASAIRTVWIPYAMVIREIMNSLPSVENDSINDCMEEPRHTENDSTKKIPRAGRREAFNFKRMA